MLLLLLLMLLDCFFSLTCLAVASCLDLSLDTRLSNSRLGSTLPLVSVEVDVVALLLVLSHFWLVVTEVEVDVDVEALAVVAVDLLKSFFMCELVSAAGLRCDLNAVAEAVDVDADATEGATDALSLLKCKRLGMYLRPNLHSSSIILSILSCCSYLLLPALGAASSLDEMSSSMSPSLSWLATVVVVVGVVVSFLSGHAASSSSSLSLSSSYKSMTTASDDCTLALGPLLLFVVMSGAGDGHGDDDDEDDEDEDEDEEEDGMLSRSSPSPLLAALKTSS